MNNEVQYVSPFKKLCITVGNLPTAYLESMSYYEALTFLTNYLANNVVPALNNNSEVVDELQTYVSTYFDNLDVQEEVNKKLDEMAEDGSLAHVIDVEMIGGLENLNTTNKTSVVNAINEVNTNTGTNATNITATDNKIGNLSNLETTAKTNVVSAINENVGSIEDLADYLNINNFTAYTTFTTNFGTATGSITIARNTSGTLCKIYGYISASDLDQTGTLECLIDTDTGLRPSSELYISGTGLTFVTSPNVSIFNPGIRLYTNGKVSFNIYSNENNSTTRYFACVIFVKDFGD